LSVATPSELLARAELSIRARRALIRSWPRNRDLEAGRLSDAPRFEKDRNIPALVASIGVSLDHVKVPCASLEFEDVEGYRHRFRVPIADALLALRALQEFQDRLNAHSAMSSGMPSPDGSPKEGQKQ
jgi:hypothetical protein